jgi:hypothetical protein
MYSMQEVAFFVFHTMLFPHNGKIVTIDQLTHYEPNQSRHIDDVLPLICSIPDLLPMVDVIPLNLHDLSLIGSYQGHTPPTPCADQVCVITSNDRIIPDDHPLEESLNPIPTYTPPTLPKEPPLDSFLE